MRRSTWGLLDVLERPADWMEFAACKDLDSELFFPVGNGEPALRQAQEAIAVCAGCPVRWDCAQWREETGSVGVWGGEYYADSGRPVQFGTSRYAVARRERKAKEVAHA